MVEGKKSLLALAVVVGVAVLREGSEVVLFLSGVLAASEDSSWSVALGGFLGLALGAAVSDRNTMVARDLSGLTPVPGAKAR